MRRRCTPPFRPLRGGSERKALSFRKAQAFSNEEKYSETSPGGKPYFENCTEIFAISGGAENNPELTPALKENLMKLYAGKLTAEEFAKNMEAAAK